MFPASIEASRCGWKNAYALGKTLFNDNKGILVVIDTQKNNVVVQEK
jgi:hypothetical protein